MKSIEVRTELEKYDLKAFSENCIALIDKWLNEDDDEYSPFGDAVLRHMMNLSIDFDFDDEDFESDKIEDG